MKAFWKLYFMEQFGGAQDVWPLIYLYWTYFTEVQLWPSVRNDELYITFFLEVMNNLFCLIETTSCVCSNNE